MSLDHTSPSRGRDPVCGMSVRVDVAVADGLIAEHDAETYYFCRESCRDAFTASPENHIHGHAHAGTRAAEPESGASPTIDDGMRRWYESCSCCLSDAYPDVKSALDAERQANAQPAVEPGICEVAEADAVSSNA